MSFIESPRFPLDIRYGVTGGDEFNTTIIVTGSGAEQRNRNWSQARGRFHLDYGPHQKEKTDALIAFFRIVGGREKAFRFRNWSDYQVLAAEGVLGAGVGTGLPTYQLAKQYTSGSNTDARTVSKPVSGTVALLRGGSPVTLGAGAGNAAVDTTTGVITFVADATASASSVTVGATTTVVLSSNPGTLTAGQKLYLSGFTGADATLLNGLAHTINSVSGSGPYTFVLATNTSGKTITLGSGLGAKYPQASEALTWSGEYDLPVRFASDALSIQIVDYGVYSWQGIELIEVRA